MNLIQRSGDGSDTLIDPTSNEPYHNLAGALTESLHVYLNSPHIAQRLYARQAPLEVLEIGFGSGLNARLFHALAMLMKRPIHYTSYEPFPITKAQFEALNHRQFFNDQALHTSLAEGLEKPQALHRFESAYFALSLKKTAFGPGTPLEGRFDHIVMDAFSPGTSGELWRSETLSVLSEALKPKATFSSFCVAGHVRRSLTNLGLSVHRLAGPPGKREILLATKPTPN